MNASLDYPNALKAVAHARALSDVEHAPLAGFTVLVIGAILSILVPLQGTWHWPGGIALGLIVAPPIVNKLLPPRSLKFYRLSLLTYILNGLLLAFLAYREISRITPLLPEEWHTLQAALPWTAPLFAAIYYLLQFHDWKERILRLPELRKALVDAPAEEAQAAVRDLIVGVRPLFPAEGVAWAEFRTVPASLQNWRLFLKLDSEVHGSWRAVFSPEFAIVLARDGRRAEVVKRGSLKIVAEDPSPGAKTIQCLLRWNSHLHEGRIAPDHFHRIQTWNKG